MMKVILQLFWKAIFNLLSIIFLFFFIPTKAQSTATDGQFEVVYTNSTTSLPNNPTASLVTGFKDESILISSLEFWNIKPHIIHQSLDQGTSWQVLVQEFDSTFFSVISIHQLSANHISEVVEGWALDSIGESKKNYWIRLSDDLGKTWIKHNVGGLPLGLHFEGSKGVFSSTTNDTAMLWTTENYGQTWKQRQLPSNMINTSPAMLGEKEFLFFDSTDDQIDEDSIYYTSNIDLNSWETKKLNKNFGANNFIALNKNRILSAKGVRSTVGITNLSYILETTNGGDTWTTPVNILEDWARRGLRHNSYIDSNNMVFLGPNVLYSSNNGGNTWERALWDDSLNGGTRGVYLFYNSKLDRRQLIFPVDPFYLLRYTIPGAVGLNASVLDKNNLKLYPNPSRNILFIKLSQSDKIIGEISVWSIEGKEILRESNFKNFNTNSVELNVASLNTGIYILKVKTENGFYCKRFVKH